jgi:hypothetical protein
VPPSALRSQVSIQIATLQAEQRDRGVDVCFRHAYLKAWYLNHGLSSLASWIPFNRACDIAESEVLAACTGQATTISCHNGNLTMPPPSAETASALTSAGLEGIKPAAMGPRVPTASLEQASEHIIRAHVETCRRSTARSAPASGSSASAMPRSGRCASRAPAWSAALRD